MAEQPDCLIEPIRDDHELDGFHCGRPPLDNFLRERARLNDSRGVSKVFVAVLPGIKDTIAYYASSAGSFNRDALNKKSRHNLPGTIPVAHLGRMAVRKDFQGMGIGQLLLFHFLSRAVQVSHLIAVFGVDVYAKDEPIAKFYLGFGFEPLADDPLHLFLPMGTVRGMFEG